MRDLLARQMVSVVGTRIPRLAAPFYPKVLWRVPTTSKTAYLTFDDGPNNGLTEHLLDILDGYDARATFFLLGEKAERWPSLVREVHERGHVVGNHSYSHPDAWKAPAAAVLREFERTTGILEDLTGQRVAFARPPYGRFTRPLVEWCSTRRHRLTMWDVGPGDYLDAMSAAAIEGEVISHVRPGSIIVLHDNPTRAAGTPAALHRILGRLTAEGWSFRSLAGVR